MDSHDCTKQACRDCDNFDTGLVPRCLAAQRQVTHDLQAGTAHHRMVHFHRKITMTDAGFKSHNAQDRSRTTPKTARGSGHATQVLALHFAGLVVARLNGSASYRASGSLEAAAASSTSQVCVAGASVLLRRMFYRCNKFNETLAGHSSPPQQVTAPPLRLPASGWGLQPGTNGSRGPLQSTTEDHC